MHDLIFQSPKNIVLIRLHRKLTQHRKLQLNKSMAACVHGCLCGHVGVVLVHIVKDYTSLLLIDITSAKMFYQKFCLDLCK